MRSCDDDKLSSQLVELPAAWNFAEVAPLPAQALDNAFIGWPGSARTVQKDAGDQLLCNAEGADFFLLYCPKDQQFFCLEPGSHSVNARHLPGRPVLQLLAYRQSCRLQFSPHYQALGD